MNKELTSKDAAAKKELIQVEYGKVIIIMRISIYRISSIKRRLLINAGPLINAGYKRTSA